MPELYVVATPIGNLSDLSARMIDTLTLCDLIAAEDTRVTMKLLAHIGIKKPLIACHRHNERQVADALVQRMLAEDLTVCLTCDAGTPGISDPGVGLVRAALAAGIGVTPVCGPTAVAAHLSVCGFDAREFAFYGFLPRENGELRQKLKRVRASGLPVAVFYESPHRVVKLVCTIQALWPDVRVSVACDISKRYEKILTGAAGEVLGMLESNPKVEKGEYSVAVDLSGLEPEAAHVELPVEAQIVMNLLGGLNLKGAAERAIEQGHARNDVYKARLRIKQLCTQME